MNIHSLIQPFFIVFFLATPFASMAQDFESKENRRLIKSFKIKEIKSYLYPEGGKPGDSMLVDHLFFNAGGQCVKEITKDDVTTYIYNTRGLKTKQISERVGKSGQVVIVFTYDKHDNMVLSEKTESEDADDFASIYFQHRFTYNSKHQQLTEEWLNKGGKMQFLERRAYLGAQPDSSITDIIQYYNEADHLQYIAKTYTNGRTVTYHVGDQHESIMYEQFVDKKNRVVKFINNRHMGPHASDDILRYGHGIIAFSKVTELYFYNKYGLIAENLTYENGAVIEKQTWHYIL